MSTNALLFGVLFLLIAIALFLLVRMERRLQRLFRGSKAATLETLMASVVEQVKKISRLTDEHSEHLEGLRARIGKEGHGIKLVRFNPFKDTGGNQSFAVALINEEGDGVVFSSLYSRDRQSIFAKPITGGKSDIELSPEEERVIEEARKEAAQ